MKTLNTLIIVALVGLAGTSKVMAEQSDFRFAEVSSVLQSCIDKKMEESLQQKTLHFAETGYVAQEQVEIDPAS